MRAWVAVVGLGACVSMFSWAAPVRAQDKPPFAPARDVTVTYRVTAPGQPLTEVRILARPGGTPMRVDMLTEGTSILFDRKAGVMTMVVPEERMAMDLPMSAGQQDFVLNDRMRFARRGTDTVAGLRCTVWDVTLGAERSTACISADGVMLRLLGRETGGVRSTMEATSVEFETQPDSAFVPPPEFLRERAVPVGPPQSAPPRRPR